MQIKQITDYLESIAPLAYAESYDNTGLLVGCHKTIVRKALLTLDCTEAVVEEAIRQKCQLIIAHHPIIFSDLKKLNGKSYVERVVMKAIKNDIAIYAIHTNYDNVSNGVNAMLCERLGVLDCHILAPKTLQDISHYNVGSGMIGRLAKPVEEAIFLKKVKKQLNARVIKHTTLLGKLIETVAVCGGAGQFLLPHAIAAGADLFITSDVKYHEFFDADGAIVLADVGHWESEQFTGQLLFRQLSEKFPTFAFLLSKIRTNPVNYL